MKGFTLVEVMLTVFIGVTGLCAVGYIMSDSGTYLARDNRARIYSLNTIRDEIENLRNTSYDTMVGYGSSFSFTSTDVPGLAKIPGATGTVTSADYLSSSFIRKVTVTVSWTGARGQSLSNSITTLMTKTGINGA